jgi:hypothetical protein
VTRDYQKLKSHIMTVHEGDMSSLKPIASTVWLTPLEPDQPLPSTATAAEALYLPIYGHPNAHVPSRTPSPIQSVCNIPLEVRALSLTTVMKPSRKPYLLSLFHPPSTLEMNQRNPSMSGRSFVHISDRQYQGLRRKRQSLWMSS